MIGRAESDGKPLGRRGRPGRLTMSPRNGRFHNQRKRGLMSAFIDRLGIIGELLAFMWQRKLWWMIPMVVVLVLVLALLVFAQGSAVAPFIYTLF